MSLALIVDDEADLCRLMQMTLKKMQIDTLIAYDYDTAIELLSKHHFDFCLTDLRLPDGSGLDIVKLIAKEYATTPVAVITAHGSMDLAIEALKLGAFDFVNKPLELPRLRQLVENAIKAAQGAQEQQDDNTPDPFSDKLIGISPPIIKLKNTIQKLARSQAPVFLWGESGTGKEVVAKLIHELSPRNQASFVPVNCGAIPSELMESEFFGHKKGSFTGATADKEGLFQQANGGTLFLDEVADLPLAMQVKLLRAIQEKKVRPIGGTQELAVDIRLVSATHKNLAQLVESGEFRQDLYYRINVIEVKLPSLNSRREDVPLLATHFLHLIEKDWQLAQPLVLTDCAQTALANHAYSGNVRELRNILERAVTLLDGHIIDAAHLNLEPNTPSSALSMPTISPSEMNLGQPAPHAISVTANTPNSQVNHSYLNNRSRFDSHITITPYRMVTPQNYVSLTPEKPSVSLPTTDQRSSTFPMIDDSSTNNNIHSVSHSQTIAEQAFESNSINPSFTSLPPEGLEEYLLNQERQLIIAALNQSGGNKTKAAKLLNTTFRSLRYRMKKLEIGSDDDD